MQTNNLKRRCSIYDKIDELKGAKNTRELTDKLIPLLNVLAYSHVNGEGAINDIHQAWKDSYYSALRRDQV